MYTLQGKPHTHYMYVFSACPRMPLVRFLWAVPVRGNLSRVINSVGQSHCYQEKGTPNYIPITQADQSVGPHPVSLPLTTIEAVEKAKHLVATSYISLHGPYHQHMISAFNTCSRVPTPQSLTDTDRGYNLGGSNFLYHPPRPSQLMILRFPLVALPGLNLTIST
jgi:hypothetical protein